MNRRTLDSYVSPEAYETYLKFQSYYEFESIQPIEEGDWFDPEDYYELVVPGTTSVVVGGSTITVPTLEELTHQGIILSSSPQIKILELCRYIAVVMEPDAYFVPEKQPSHLPEELTLLLRLKEWNHPDLLNEERPSESETFQQLAQVIETGDSSYYRLTLPPNTHWSHWPEMKDL